MIKEDNQSDKHLTVAGLTVLGDVQSTNLQRFEKNLQETFDKTQNLTAQQKEFWKNLADDNLITPVEKKQIKQEIAIIEKTYQAIHKKAQEVSQEFNPLFTSYATAYRELKDYITELKLFDNMNENTRVNKTEFNLKFSDYYEFENVVQSVFLGTPTYTMRVLASLNDLGKEGEVAIYRNTFYRWESDRWVLVSGNTYLGKQNSLPTVGSYGDFFLAETDFTGYVKYKANGKFLKSNGKFLATTKKFKKGFIYKLTVTGWEVVENKNDHRYVIATEDLIEIGETISLHLQKWFTDTAEELKEYNERFVLIDTDLDGIKEKYHIVDGIIKDLEGNIVEINDELKNKIEVIPKYLGAVNTLPTTKFKGDWFTWKADTTNKFVKGFVYMWNGSSWEEVKAQDSKNYQMLMTALTDILATNATGTGYFSTVFASALVASNAFIQNLQSQIITLTQALDEQGKIVEGTGIIQSSNYVSSGGLEGWRIAHDGKAEFKHVTLDYIKSSYAELSDSKFSGELDCGNLQVQTMKNEVLELSYGTYNSTEHFSIGRAAEFLALFKVDSSYIGEVTHQISTIFGNNRRCVINGKEVSQLRLHKYQSGTTYIDDYIYVYAIYKDNTSEYFFRAYVDRYMGGNNTKQEQKYLLQVFHNKGNTKQLMLKNLESSEPTTQNIVWADSNGYLRIKK